MSADRLQGKVAQILNERELVINIGAADGVQRDMKFSVLAAEPLEIMDPDTGDVIDRIEQEKVRVEVARLRDKTAICRTYRVTRTPGIRRSDLSFNLGLAFSEEIPETLRADQKSLPKPLSPEESYVKIGDVVVQMG